VQLLLLFSSCFACAVVAVVYMVWVLLQAKNSLAALTNLTLQLQLDKRQFSQHCVLLKTLLLNVTQWMKLGKEMNPSGRNLGVQNVVWK
jgi:hypothetical protein